MSDTYFSDTGISFQKKISVALRREGIVGKLRNAAEERGATNEVEVFQAMVEYERAVFEAAQVAYKRMIATGLVK